MNQTQKIIISAVAIIILATGGYFFGRTLKHRTTSIDNTPKIVTLSGTYICLPHLKSSGVQTEECRFGLETAPSEYYAVNFGQSANAMTQFQARAKITAEGFVVPKMALSSSEWATYDMVGIFTITKLIEPAPATSTKPTNSGNAKLNITVVCESALAYMTFPNGAAADAFIADCKAGKHPEVIERYKAEMNLGDGATI